MAKAYLEAHKIKEKRKVEEMKWITWEQGLYVYEAICDVSPVLRAFSEIRKPLPYPEQPYGLEKNVEKIKEIEEERDMYTAQIFFQNWAREMKKRFNNRKEE